MDKYNIINKYHDGFDKLTCQRNLEGLKYKSSKYEVILVSKSTYNTNLIIKAKNPKDDSKSKIIPVDKNVICENLAYFAARLSESSNWEEPELLDGVSIIEVETDEPDLLGHYFESIYDQELLLDKANCPFFYKWADYFSDTKGLPILTKYCTENISHYNIFKLFKFGDVFEEPIRKFMRKYAGIIAKQGDKKNKEIVVTTMAMKAKLLEKGEFIDFCKRCCPNFREAQVYLLVRLVISWLDHNLAVSTSGKSSGISPEIGQSYHEVITGISFGSLTDQDIKLMMDTVKGNVSGTQFMEIYEHLTTTDKSTQVSSNGGDLINIEIVDDDNGSLEVLDGSTVTDENYVNLINDADIPGPPTDLGGQTSSGLKNNNDQNREYQDWREMAFLEKKIRDEDIAKDRLVKERERLLRRKEFFDERELFYKTALYEDQKNLLKRKRDEAIKHKGASGSKKVRITKKDTSKTIPVVHIDEDKKKERKRDGLKTVRSESERIELRNRQNRNCVRTN